MTVSKGSGGGTTKCLADRGWCQKLMVVGEKDTCVKGIQKYTCNDGTKYRSIIRADREPVGWAERWQGDGLGVSFFYMLYYEHFFIFP